MGRVKTYMGGLALFAFLGFAAGDCLGLAAALVAGILGWVDRDSGFVLVVVAGGVGALAGLVAGIAYQTPSARARRALIASAELEIRLAEQRRRWQGVRRAERQARWRHWWSEVVPFAVMGVLGSVAFLAFTASCVFSVMAAMGLDDSLFLPIGVAIALVLGVPVIVLAVRSIGGGRSGGGGFGGGGFGGGGLSGDNDFLDSGGD